MRKLIVDTDIGSDIDDAIAIVFLLKSRAREIDCITTVYRNAERRARLAKTILKEFGGEKIPVYAGIDLPLTQIPEKIEPPWFAQNYDEEGRYLPSQCLDGYLSSEIDGRDGVFQLIERLRNHPQTEILTIGPVTNPATAIRIAPELFKGRKIVMMAGCMKKLVLSEEVGEQYIAEWNVLADPEAMNIVLRSGAEITLVGLDVSHQCYLPEETQKGLIEGCKSDIFGSMLDAWKKSFGTDNPPTLFDPVAAAAVLVPEFFTFKDYKVRVELQGENRGVLFEDPDGVNVKVAVGLDRERFFRFFAQTLREKEKEIIV